MRFPLPHFLLIAGVTQFATPASEPRQPEQPNIVLVLIDDLGWQDISVPMWSERTPLNDRYHTPHLARLAERGVVFTNAYASSPVCTPTRVSIMTGQAPARHRVSYWTLHADRDTSAPHPTLSPPPWSLRGLQPGAATLPSLLRGAGYDTYHVGKAHFGSHDTPGADPTNLGFDVTVGGHASGAPASYLGVHNFSASGRQNKPHLKSVWDVPGLAEYHGRDTYLTEALTERAEALITDSMDRDRPFFLWFAPYAVHTPIMANTRHIQRYEGLDPREAAYASMIETVDAALGRLLDATERAGMLEETVFIFWSDNGALSAHARAGERHTHNAPLRSGKGSCYEGGIRVPGLIAWPGVTEHPSRLDAPVIAHDLMPTILSMAGVRPGLDNPDSVDLTPLIRSGADGVDDRLLGWHMPHQWGAPGPGIEPFTAIRRGAHKLIYFHAGRRFELYNLNTDIAESHDLTHERPDLARRLATAMDEYLRDSSAQMSIDTVSGRPIESPTQALGAFLQQTDP